MFYTTKFTISSRSEASRIIKYSVIAGLFKGSDFVVFAS
jgi:hypothetical protein